MAITKWMGFGTGQANGTQNTTTADEAKVAPINGAEYKQFGLENVSLVHLDCYWRNC